MKTSEFVKYFEDEGFKVFKNHLYLSVIDIRDGIDLTVSFTDTDLTFPEQQEYYKVIVDYLLESTFKGWSINSESSLQ